ncbi:MAG: SPFH domain-containing protein [Ignavibacteriales bacterium]
MFSILGYIILTLALGYFLSWVVGVRRIPNNKVGIVEKWWSPKGSLKQEIIALNGEAGFQPELLRGGIYFKTPLIYKIHKVPLVTIPQGQMAYVFARDGKSLEPTQTLGREIKEGNNFQDVRAFIENGGQKGPQRAIIREGTYALNIAQFVVITENYTYCLPLGIKGEKEILQQMSITVRNRDGFTPIIISGKEDKIGIVTVHDGPSLDGDEIIAPVVGNNSSKPNYHNNFQDPEKFLQAGGIRGRQYQVLVDGTYFINRLFATVDFEDKTVVPVGFVGVVISYVGPKGEDLSGEEYKHGQLVHQGSKGVWQEPLPPGKYAFNVYAGKISLVPTTNIILKWISNDGGEHRYDENLKEVTLITRDAFEPSLPLSVVLHIDPQKAPMVIQRFGDIQRLVEQTIDPMVSAFFKNKGQRCTLIELIHQRDEIQEASTLEMRERFAKYNLELEEVLIGTPTGSENDDRIEKILAQLRDRQIAKEQVETFHEQQKAATKERELNQAMALAARQKALTESAIEIEIKENEGIAELKKALQDAEKIKTLAVAEAEKAARIGIGQAIAADELVRAYGGPQFLVMKDSIEKVASAWEASGSAVVPQTLINMGGGEGGTANLFNTLLSMVLSEKLGVDFKASEMSPEISALRESILQSMKAGEKEQTMQTIS